MEQAARVPRAGASLPTRANRPPRFRLIRYFTLSTLIAFATVGLAVYLLQRLEENFFEQVQHDQAAFLAQAQSELARQHENTARSNLLMVHEAAHVMLTRVFANMLWKSDVAPLVAAAQHLPVDECRAIAGDEPAIVQARRACFAALGRRITALPGFDVLEARASATMQSTSVFKIKVFDLRGITVYSSERAQIGEDKADNAGWRLAMSGRPASELTHRDRFSAFESVVEDRDLISSYIPVRAVGGSEIVGVFEIYSDATPFLGQIRSSSAAFVAAASENEARLEQVARANQAKVNASSRRFLLIVGALLALLYAASWLIVRNGQRIIDRQSLANEQATQREQLWHREKMAALATLAANVSHEVGNPLAIISGLAEDLADRHRDDATVAEAARLILAQTARVASMTRQISDFAAERNEQPEWVDVNAMVKSVCDFFTFDRRFRSTPIEFRPGERLPAREIVPDHLNEVMMGVLQACVEDTPPSSEARPIRVQTAASGDDVEIRVACAPSSPGEPCPLAQRLEQGRFESVRRRVAEMGGRLSSGPAGLQITLPPSAA